MTIAFASNPNKRTALSQVFHQFTGIIPDPYFNLTTLLLPGNGTNGAQNNTFLDSSTNNFTITRNGNTTQGTFSPYGGGWSNYFGTTQFKLSTTGMTGLGSDFTLELWIYPTSFNDYNTIFDNRTSDGDASGLVLGLTSAAKVYFYTNAAFQITTATSISLNTWTHIALVRSGAGSGNVKIYINGVADANTATYTTNFTRTAPSIGDDWATRTNLQYYGYLSNLRATTSALYTGSFTPSTTPLTAISGTVLLTCQSNRFIDNSFSALTMTVTGTPTVQRFNPFNPATTTPTSYSGYFDGSGDYLSASNASLAFGNSNFTLECWVYATSTPSDVGIFEGRNLGSGTSGFTLTAFNSTTIRIFSGSALITSGSINYLNTWCHVAVVRASGTTTLYINGQSQGTTTSLGNLTDSSFIVGAGRYTGVSTPSAFFPGYISNFRIVNGSAVYNGNFTPPTAPLTAITNTSLLLNFTNAGIYDATSKNDLETVGDAQISNTTAKWGGSSMYFDGSDYLIDNLYTNQNYALGSGSWTIEGWFYNQNVSGSSGLAYLISVWGIVGQADTTYSQFVLRAENNNLQVVLQPAGGGGLTSITGAGGGLTANTWQHLAAVRNGNNVSLYINGTSVASTTYTSTLNNPASRLVLGAQLSGAAGASYYTGYMNDIRITKGYARTITTPTSAFPLL